MTFRVGGPQSPFSYLFHSLLRLASFLSQNKKINSGMLLSVDSTTMGWSLVFHSFSNVSLQGFLFSNLSFLILCCVDVVQDLIGLEALAHHCPPLEYVNLSQVKKKNSIVCIFLCVYTRYTVHCLFRTIQIGSPTCFRGGGGMG